MQFLACNSSDNFMGSRQTFGNAWKGHMQLVMASCLNGIHLQTQEAASSPRGEAKFPSTWMSDVLRMFDGQLCHQNRTFGAQPAVRQGAKLLDAVSLGILLSALEALC